MAPTGPAVVDLEDVRAGVDAALARHLAELAGEVAEQGVDAQPLLDAMETMLAGGKRLRAAFCYWSWRAHGGVGPQRSADAASSMKDPRATPSGAEPAATPSGADRATVLRVGAALELFQAAALFHDDVMDGSSTRRGRPSAHRVFAARHAGAGWAGDPDRFGESAAILLGDLALIAGEREFADAVAALPATVALPARRVFEQMRTEVTVGQYLDVLAQALPWGQDAAGDEARARAVIRAKSARYSVEHPLTLGAALAGAGEEATARCRRVGLPLGEAFQMRDDLLGVFGDPEATGKPAGDDLREGKRTVLVARALQVASDDDAALLLDRLGDRAMTEGEIAALRSAILRTGAPDSLEELITSLARPALAELATAPLDEPGRTVLVDLGHAAVDRRA